MDYDPDKIQEIVSNLLSNAIKFTPEKGAVELNADQLEEDGKEMFQLTVRDTGRGIDSDILPHVFDRYFTVESPSGPNTEGTGLVKPSVYFIPMAQPHSSIPAISR